MQAMQRYTPVSLRNLQVSATAIEGQSPSEGPHATFMTLKYPEVWFAVVAQTCTCSLKDAWQSACATLYN